MKSIIIGSVVFCGFGYLLALALLYSYQDNLLFHASRESQIDMRKLAAFNVITRERAG